MSILWKMAVFIEKTPSTSSKCYKSYKVFFSALVILYLNPLLHIDVFWRLFDTPVFLRPQTVKNYPIYTVFRLGNSANKVKTFRHRPLSKRFIRGLPEGGCATFCLGALKWGGSPPHRQENFGLWEAKNDPRSTIR
jgi:hypothetical protein